MSNCGTTIVIFRFIISLCIEQIVLARRQVIYFFGFGGHVQHVHGIHHGIHEGVGLATVFFFYGKHSFILIIKEALSHLKGRLWNSACIGSQTLRSQQCVAEFVWASDVAKHMQFRCGDLKQLFRCTYTLHN